MSPPVLEAVLRQVTRLRRRLLLQTLLRFLLAGWAIAFLITACWFLAQPYLFGGMSAAWRWAGAAVLFLGGSGLAIFQAIRQVPTPRRAALALDERFGLKERITTALCLTPEQCASPAGQALLADVWQRIGTLNVREKFPLKLSWPALLAPALTAVLAALAFFYEPPPGRLQANDPSADPIPVAQAKEIEKKLDILKKVMKQLPKEQLNPEKMKELEAAWNKLLKNPIDAKDRDTVRDYARSVRSIEEQLKERMKELQGLNQKNKALKEQLGKLPEQNKKHPGDKLSDPDAKGVQDALSKGDFAKAAEQIEKLSKKLKENQKDEKQAKELQDEMDKLKNQLQRLAEQKEARDQLQRERDEGKIDQEQLERELEQLDQLAEQLQGLRQMGMTLEEFQKMMKEGKFEKASMKLEDLAKLLKELKENGEALDKLDENQQALEEARLALLQGLNQGKDGPKDPLPGGGRQEGAVGKRPQGPEHDTKSVDAREKGKSDLKGKTRLIGLGRGGTFNKIPSKEVSGAFEQARQQAPEAIERQRIPEEAADFAKGYFENLGGQKKQKR